jgi:hypothetical protein
MKAKPVLLTVPCATAASAHTARDCASSHRAMKATMADMLNVIAEEKRVGALPPPAGPAER